MSYEQRNDGRKFNELRPISAEVGVVKNAVGSARFQIGKTIAYAAVYGPRELHPRHLQSNETGRLRCFYNMMAFSGSGERVRPGPSRRSKEIGLITEQALLPVLDLGEFPKAVVDVFIELLQTDAGTRCAGICAASMALADAGFRMKDMVAAVSCGLVGGKVLVDLDYSEEAYDEGSVDVPVGVMPRSGQIVLLQADGLITQEQLMQAVKLARQKCKEIYELQKAVLKKKYGATAELAKEGEDDNY